MRIGIDTSFFISQINGQPRAVQIWQEFLEGKHQFIVSTLSIHEIFIYFYRRGTGELASQWQSLLIEFKNIVIVPVSVDIAARSARLRHGMGLPAIDSLLLATFLHQNCELIVSTDNHFRVVAEQHVLPVEIIR
ncbi:MAG: type II toxin-antitoxin system VapC family toxin [Caldilinea sp. CFX5]|nr:type II toxin-antitoxin system VapC family toxin [Caldilinea sp. CFX5]